MSPEAVAERLNLNEIHSHEWGIQGTCGLTGEGLTEGLNWIHSRQGRVLAPERFGKTKSARS